MADIILNNPSASAAENVERIKAAIANAHKAYMEDTNPGKVPVKVILGEGTWLVTGDKNNASAGAIELLSGVELTGSGNRGTVIQLEDNFNARINGIVRTALTDVENVKISNLVIDGNRDKQAAGSHQAGFICGVKDDPEDPAPPSIQRNITIDGVEVMDCTAYGFNPHEATYGMVIKNSIAHNNGLDGFVADAVIGGTYENNVSYDNDRHGFNIQNATQNLILKNNEAYDNGFRYINKDGELSGGAGLTIQRGDIAPEGSTTIPWVSGIQVIGGSYHENGKEGILVKLSDRVTIDGADIFGNMRQGVRIEGATYTIVKNSTIHDNAQGSTAQTQYDEINIRLRDDTLITGKIYYSTDTQILNNTINSDGVIRARYSIREEPTNDDNKPGTVTVISDNDVGGATSGGISAPGYKDIWIGTAGDDTIGGGPNGEQLRGLGGNDTYTVNNSKDVVIEEADQGIDHVFANTNFTLSANVEHLTIEGNRVSQTTGKGMNGRGNELANQITGNHLANELEGFDGNDTLNGGAGIDKLVGGNGNDTYYVDSASDYVIEKTGKMPDGTLLGGVDTVYSSVSYTINDLTSADGSTKLNEAGQVENLRLLGSANINGTGNSLKNVLIGNSGNNVLDGRANADLMEGGLGHDTYYVDDTSDVVAENIGAGTDTIYSSVAFTLGQFVENLTLQGDKAIVGSGNELNNIIVGNNIANKLNGQGGNDTLSGGLGNDTIDGGADTDTVVYAGNSSAYAINVTNTGYTVQGAGGDTDDLRGIEIIQFEDRRLVGGVWQANPVDPGNPSNPGNPGNPGNPSNPADPSLPVASRTGTSRPEKLNGTDGVNNIIKGQGGSDTIKGLGGNDSLSGGTGNDKVYGDSGDDRVNGDSGNDWVYGGSGNDRAYGGTGHDKVYGNAGNDWVYGGSNNDTVDGGSGDDWVYGDSGNDRVYGGLGSDVINGGSSNDRLFGGAGSDAFVFNSKLGSASSDRNVNFDTISDFNVKFDSLWLDNAIFKKLGSGTLSNPGELNKEFFVTGTRARERDDYLIYNKKTGVLSYDADGSGSREAVEFAKLSNNLKLTYKDFFVI